MNKVILMGRLTREPELKQTPNGVNVCSFSIAVNRRYKNTEGNYDADFVNCVAWRQTGEFVSKYFAKGRMIAVAGSLQTRTYEKDGQKRYVTEVLVDEVNFCGEKAEEKPAGNDAGNLDLSGFAPMPAGDDLPF